MTDRSEKIGKISYFTVIFKHNFGYAIFLSLDEATFKLSTCKLLRSAGFKVLPTWISVISTLLVFDFKKVTTSSSSSTKLTIFFCLIRIFSVIIVYVRNIFDMIRLLSFSTNINENEVCTENFDQIFENINTHFPP